MSVLVEGQRITGSSSPSSGTAAQSAVRCDARSSDPLHVGGAPTEKLSRLHKEGKSGRAGSGD